MTDTPSREELRTLWDELREVRRSATKGVGLMRDLLGKLDTRARVLEDAEQTRSGAIAEGRAEVAALRGELARLAFLVENVPQRLAALEAAASQREQAERDAELARARAAQLEAEEALRAARLPAQRNEPEDTPAANAARWQFYAKLLAAAMAAAGTVYAAVEPWLTAWVPAGERRPGSDEGKTRD